MTCRVCGSSNTSVVPIGRYANFFLLRVDTKKDSFQLYSRAHSIKIDPTISDSLPVRALRKAKRILFPPQFRQAAQFRTQMQACESCHAITPSHEYSFDDLLGLYRDYRSETYNQDRISVEPDYARIAKNVGDDPIEINNRNTAVDKFLSRRMLAIFQVERWSTTEERKNAYEGRYSICSGHFESSGAGCHRRDERRCNDVSNAEWRVPPALGSRASHAG